MMTLYTGLKGLHSAFDDKIGPNEEELDRQFLVRIRIKQFSKGQQSMKVKCVFYRVSMSLFCLSHNLVYILRGLAARAFAS